MPPGGIFISYAAEDVGAVRRLKAALDAQHLPSWFDKDDLKAGDPYNHKIERCVEECRLFMPIISNNTERRLEGYFRREWRLASKRSWGMHSSRAFIVPVVVGDRIDEAHANVPDEFVDAQWTHLPGGVITTEFSDRLRQLLRAASEP